jgi:hypothetical protein
MKERKGNERVPSYILHSMSNPIGLTDKCIRKISSRRILVCKLMLTYVHSSMVGQG